ncbi:Copper type II ascorbate-dependent monooxygenase, C-terminal domain [Pedobacter steynii]|uniref:Copper type II ascorbate-dependent monooxygenase, C-terminal domain n=1 Tax=Pedobacter steynii TaxID=430522 RepID=A0A1H0GNS1_9SPHI|nr:calcium-binding protein [Pedobacter steynii]NQX42475.1 cytochrome c [Pedobacter steynii]SDO08452.1 Copper type II ascorbate-dependent monooxygenase, C-terminal domain [Pedobacter steynii]
MRILIFIFLSFFFCNQIVAQKITFSTHIAPIIQQKCAPCHRPGEAAPFSLLTYQDVAKRGTFIKDVVQSGYMPPWKPDNNYRTFHNDRSLSKAEKELIVKWVDSKMPEGSVKKSAKENSAIVYIQGTQYHRKPDTVLKVSKPFFIKGDNEERFLVFKIPFDLAKDQNVEAVEFVSSNKKVIHHANFAVHPVENEVDILQGADYVDLSGSDRSKYDQYLPFKKKMDYYGGWIPGTSFESYPKDFGWVMPKRGVILLTIHYAPTGKDEEEMSGINFFFTKSAIKRKVDVISLGSAGVGESSIEPYFMIPADTTKAFNLKIVTPQDQSLLYIWPHMHLLGKTFKAYAVTPQGDTVKLVSIPSWDFKWQEIYRYKKLIKIPKGSILTIEALYDNTKENPKNPNHPPKMVFSANDMKTTDEMMTMLMVFLKYEEGDENLELDK